MPYQPITPANYTRITGDTIEHLLVAKRAILFGIYLVVIMIGILKDVYGLANGAAVTMDVAAIGLTQQGKAYGPAGVEMTAGLTVTLSAAGDSVLII